MEKYHTIVKIELLRKELRLGEFERAYQIVQMINLKKIGSMSDLSLAAETYVHAGEFDKAKRIYLHIYEKTRSKRILSKLVHVSIKLLDADMAEQYLEQYDKEAPEDFYRHIFRYNLYKLQGKGLPERIEVLRQLKEREYIDYWVYELAKLYHKAGEGDKCRKECEDLILWFGAGEYVEKAKALKTCYEKGIHRFNMAERLKNMPWRRDMKETSSEDADSRSGDEDIGGNGSKGGDEDIGGNGSKGGDEDIGGNGSMGGDEDIGGNGSIGGDMEEAEEDLFSSISRNVESAAEEIKKSIKIPEALLKRKKPENRSGLKDEDFEKTIYKLLKEEKGKEEKGKEDNVLFPYPEREEYAEEYSTELKALLEAEEIRLEELFSGYFAVSSLRSQIIGSMEHLIKKRPAGIVISDDVDDSYGRMLLAKKMAEAICRMGLAKSKKAAVLHADKINLMHLPQKKEQLADGCLIIEDAAKLSGKSFLGVHELYEKCGGKILCILEDVKDALYEKLKEEEERDGLFYSRIHLHNFSIEEWKRYLYELFAAGSCEITVEAENELEKKLIEMQDGGGVQGMFEKVTAFAKRCIRNSEKRSSGLLLKMSADLRLDSTMLMVIRAEDL